MKNNLDYAIKLIQQSDGLLITAGAGMSVDSGLPDFRSSGGFWNAYPPLKMLNLEFSQIATPAVYQHSPLLAYWFFGHRLKQYRETLPHAGYHILKRWAEKMPKGYFVFTSNVDGAFQKAGFADDRIYEVHGSLHRLQCLHNCQNQSWSSAIFEPTLDDQHCRLLNDPPHCPHCNRLARQNVLMFNDWHFCDTAFAWKKEALHHWLKQVNNLLVIELGAGKAIPTVRRFSERTAKMKKANFIRINMLEAGVPKAHFLGVEMNILQALVTLDSHLNKAVNDVENHI